MVKIALYHIDDICSTTYKLVTTDNALRATTDNARISATSRRPSPGYIGLAAAAKPVVFSLHAEDRLSLRARLGFVFTHEDVIDAIRRPDRVKVVQGAQGQVTHSFKRIPGHNERYALKVVHAERNDHIVVITLHPVSRKRYAL